MRTLTVGELVAELALSVPMGNTVVEVAPSVFTIVGTGEQPAPAEAVEVKPTGQAKVVPADLGPMQEPEPQFEMYVEGKPAPPRVNKAVREFPEEDS